MSFTRSEHLGNGLDVQVSKILIEPAEGRIRAYACRRSVRNAVQGVDADKTAAEPGCPFPDLFEVGKVSDTPVSFRREGIEVQAKAPYPALFPPLRMSFVVNLERLKMIRDIA